MPETFDFKLSSGVAWEDTLPIATVTFVTPPTKPLFPMFKLAEALADQYGKEVRMNRRGATQGHYFSPQEQSSPGLENEESEMHSNPTHKCSSCGGLAELRYTKDEKAVYHCGFCGAYTYVPIKNWKPRGTP